MKNETLEFHAKNGGSTAYIALPEDTSEAKAVLVIQEYWGLNDHIKNIANRYADEGFIAIAPDLYRGNLTTDKEQAAKWMQELSMEDGLNIIESVINKVNDQYHINHFGITGYCMGGTGTLNRSIASTASAGSL